VASVADPGRILTIFTTRSIKNNSLLLLPRHPITTTLYPDLTMENRPRCATHLFNFCPLVHLYSNRPTQKRSRWNAPGTKAFIPGVPHLIPSGIDKECMEALLGTNSLSIFSIRLRGLSHPRFPSIVRVRIEELTHSINTGQLGLDDPTIRRSPSPPPKYDSQGKRTNTREQRTKEKLTLERQSLIQIATKLNPAFKVKHHSLHFTHCALPNNRFSFLLFPAMQPPSDYRPINVKKTRKIRVPIDKYPDYNFIGLIIGPRGDTHKQLEKKSGAKISIRGKGSQKEGQAGKKFTGDEEEDLHVLITGDTDKQLDIVRPPPFYSFLVSCGVFGANARMMHNYLLLQLYCEDNYHQELISVLTPNSHALCSSLCFV
jgi:hypothetical protein